MIKFRAQIQNGLLQMHGASHFEFTCKSELFTI